MYFQLHGLPVSRNAERNCWWAWVSSSPNECGMLLTVVYEELESDRDRECQNANKYSSIKFRSFCLDVDFESISREQVHDKLPGE